MTITRRTCLGRVTAVVVAGLAGCLAAGGDAGDDPDETTYVPVEPDYKGWFDGVSNYHRTVDARGQSSVTVAVGVQGDTGFYKFGPAAVAVSPGTTVTWRWTGKGGTHDVVSKTGLFHSGPLTAEAGHTFSYAFETPGVFYYRCEPHDALGMRGAIFVTIE